MQPSARWHHGHLGRLAQYFSLDVDGAWAELVRWEHIRTEEERLNLRAILWQGVIVEDAIADLRTFDVIEHCGIDPGIVIDDEHAACRDLAEQLIDAGYRGLIAPSASLTGSVNLTLFGSRREIYPDEGLGENFRPHLYIPVRQLVEGSPPATVLARARLYGDPHDGYEAWRNPRR